ncbi:pentatricopeptide repeat-containing protein At3g61360-like [Henckelia pumila]|uniref:pentatricopeptide repeat-containing protein At3g61360-like n=1 Tax=Henckelia pumila TaxID=405737 RepID=UPI003C6E1C9A
MKEAQSVFNKMHMRYAPDIKTMNILLLGFKESGDVTAVELFYHEMVRRGFTPNNVTYNIRIDAYSKKGHFGDALRLFEEMERVNLLAHIRNHNHIDTWSGIKGCHLCCGLDGRDGSRGIELDNVTYHTMFLGLMRVDLGLDLWNYLVKKGQCPHNHALNLLVTGLCSRGRVEEAFDCCKQMLVRGRHVSELVFEMLKRFLVQMEEFDRLGELENMIKR